MKLVDILYDKKPIRIRVQPTEWEKNSNYTLDRGDILNT